MAEALTKFKIKGLPTEKEYAALPFGRRIEHSRAIAAFQASAKSEYVSQKRQSYQKAIKDLLKLAGATEYFCTFHCSEWVKDDTFQVWFK